MIGNVRIFRRGIEYTDVFLLSVFFWVAQSSLAFGYIGPGAGLAIAGSFLVLVFAFFSSLLLLLTWPIRRILQALRYRKAMSRSKIQRAVVLGFDGMDYHLTARMLAEGKLPHFAALKAEGCFRPLRSTIPPISPVAWSSFQTGVNPGKHRIFDFLTHDRKTYRLRLSSTEIEGPRRSLSLGKFRIPLGRPSIRGLRKGVPFWRILGDHGIFSSILRVPITFPPERFHGVQLSGMCVPDLRGSQGIFSFHTTAPKDQEENTGGEVYRLIRNGDTVISRLKGPDHPYLKQKTQLTCPFALTLLGRGQARLKICGVAYDLQQGQYSGWIPVFFRYFGWMRISGMCMFLLQETEPEVRLYVTPIQIDPERPVMPISSPAVFAAYLAKRQGRYATLGLAEDSWALNEKFLSDEQFLHQCWQSDRERERMFYDSLDKTHQGLCVCVFDGTDRIQHSFWRQLDAEHPVHRGQYQAVPETAVERAYRNADRILGETRKRFQDGKTLLMVISDHGFQTFRRGVDLNRWLEENGYLVLKQGGRWQKNLAGIDWSRTRAFALGLAGIYMNLQGREACGMVSPGEEAQTLCEEIAERLHHLQDRETGQSVVKKVYLAGKTYIGPYKQEGPDLLVGYLAGYRASWETAIGQVSDKVFHDNLKAWSGDHCIDRSLVPGIFFCNRRIAEEEPRLLDIGPTILDLFGVEPPVHMDGRPLHVEMGDR